ncbi:hypothetical protein ACJX0J_017640, partial [Zea mays]
MQERLLHIILLQQAWNTGYFYIFFFTQVASCFMAIGQLMANAQDKCIHTDMSDIIGQVWLQVQGTDTKFYTSSVSFYLGFLLLGQGFWILLARPN